MHDGGGRDDVSDVCGGRCDEGACWWLSGSGSRNSQSLQRVILRNTSRMLCQCKSKYSSKVITMLNYVVICPLSKSVEDRR